MKFSLVLATIGRKDELKLFLESLCKQTYKHFKLIIVDQNPPGYLDSVLAPYGSSFELIHIFAQKGLSRARNEGLKLVESDSIVCFPDDDCIYPETLLGEVASIISNDIDGFSCRVLDFNLKPTFGRFDKIKGFINKRSVWTRACSITFFLKYDKEIRFDENIGAGSNTPWGSGEETDYLLNYLKKGARIFYDPSFYVLHPKQEVHDHNKLYKYSLGTGYVLRKHSYSLWQIFTKLLRPVLGIGFFLLRGNLEMVRYHRIIFKGRFIGVLSSGR